MLDGVIARFQQLVRVLSRASFALSAVLGAALVVSLGVLTGNLAAGAEDLATHADPPLALPSPKCTLYVNAGSEAQERQAWGPLGYTVVPRSALTQLVTAQQAMLLNNTSFILWRTDKTNQLRVSTTNGTYRYGWKPVLFNVPAAGQPLDARYSCATMTRRLPFFSDVRASLSDSLRLLAGQPTLKTRGEIILDLERSYLVRAGIPEFEENLSEQYLALLKRVRELKEQSKGEDLFKTWFAVRKLVYGQDGFGVDYCGDNANMSMALRDRCVNCVGETYLLSALWFDAGFTPPPDYVFKTQLFNDHVRPVLYNASEQKTVDLVNGLRSKAKAVIVDVKNLWQALYLGDPVAFRFPNEIKWVESLPLDYTYVDPSCPNERPPTPSERKVALLLNRGRAQAANFSFIQSCGWFRPPGSKVPAFASNRGKTQSALTEGGDSEYDGGEGEIEDESRTMPLGAEDKAQLLELAKGASPGERTALNELVKSGGRISPRVRSAFSLRRVLADFGRADLIGRPEYPATSFPEMRPIGLKEFQSNAQEPTVWTFKNEASYLELALQRNVPQFQSFEFFLVDGPEWRQRLAGVSTGRKIRIIADAVLARVDEVGRKVQPALTSTDLRERLSHLDADTLYTYMDRLSEAVGLFQQQLGDAPNLQSKSPNPLRDAGFDLVFRGERYELVKELLQLARDIDASPIKVLQTMTDNPNRAYRVARVINALDRLINKIRSVHEYAPKIDFGKMEWTSSAQYENYLGNKLLLNVLTDPKYFFTAKPDPSEPSERRQVNPKPLRDLRDRKQEFARRELDLPRINLPTYTGFVCPSGYRGLYHGLGFAVQCGAPTPLVGTSDTQQSQDIAGLPESASVVDTPRPPRIPSDREQDGLSAREQDGESDFATASSQNNTDKPGRAAGETVSKRKPLPEMTPPDPRTEVHLDPEVWLNLLSVASIDFKSETLIKTLLHHAYRTTLFAAFRAASYNANFMFLDSSDLGKPGTLLISLKEWREAIVNPARFTEWARGNTGQVNVYGAYAQEAFLKIARMELKKPKRGYWVRTADRAAGTLSELNEFVAAMKAWRTSPTIQGVKTNLQVPYNFRIDPTAKIVADLIQASADDKSPIAPLNAVAAAAGVMITTASSAYEGLVQSDLHYHLESRGRSLGFKYVQLNFSGRNSTGAITDAKMIERAIRVFGQSTQGHGMNPADFWGSD